MGFLIVSTLRRRTFQNHGCANLFQDGSGARVEIEEATVTNIVRMAELQDKLYAEGREGIVVLFQAMDAAGKDSTIRRVMSGLNPQGVHVARFKQPTPTELAHDYLWRAVVELPPRGTIALFNRSYYEDVLVARVHHLERGYNLPNRCTKLSSEEFYARRYRHMRDFEAYLWGKATCDQVFLHESLDEQKERFLERIDNPAKNWKFSAGDLDERELWSDYMAAYETAINETATKHAPWYIVPADQKWYARWLISQLVLETLEICDPHYPAMPEEQKPKLADCRRRLMEA
jgi:PPK2 family polyphosphate:nucleotide phosphotransferase